MSLPSLAHQLDGLEQRVHTMSQQLTKMMTVTQGMQRSNRQKATRGRRLSKNANSKLLLVQEQLAFVDRKQEEYHNLLTDLMKRLMMLEMSQGSAGVKPLTWPPR